LFICVCEGMFRHMCACTHMHLQKPEECQMSSLPFSLGAGLSLILGLMLSWPGWMPASFSYPVSSLSTSLVTGVYETRDLLHGFWDLNSGPHVGSKHSFFFFKYSSYVFCSCMLYIVAVFRHTRRGPQISLQMVVSHHVVAGN
jgi:4-amino-4-deoxy-L-arabinose transferase-like glycosyltransferase